MEQRTTFESRDVTDVASKDPELHKLVMEHRELDGRIEQFVQRPYLTPMEEVEMKVLKKEKLLRKDRIEAILARTR